MTANKTKRPASTPNQRDYTCPSQWQAPHSLHSNANYIALHLHWDLSPPSSSMATVARKMLLLELTFQRLEPTAGCFPAEGDIKCAPQSEGKHIKRAQLATACMGSPDGVCKRIIRRCVGIGFHSWRLGSQKKTITNLPMHVLVSTVTEALPAREPANLTPFIKSVGSVHISLL